MPKKNNNNTQPPFPLQKRLPSRWEILFTLEVWVAVQTCEVAEDTEGDGEAGGVSRLQGRFSVT